MTTGKFITIEGGEGLGKSTALRFIEAYLQDKSHDYVLTREPGGTAIAESIRRVLLAKFDETMDAETELLLMFAARNQHVTKVIKPALADGKIVICDRYMDASYAYQGGGRELGSERVASLEQWLNLGVKPDATILLDAPVEVGFERIKAERGIKDRIEEETLGFFNRVRQAYLDRAKALKDQYHVVNADQDIDSVQGDVIAAMIQVLS